MKRERWIELETNMQAKLTPNECREGWHFCPDWDFMCTRVGDGECDDPEHILDADLL